MFSEWPARILADFKVDLAYPRHRDDSRITELRHETLVLLGLGANWQSAATPCRRAV